jgi:hypothetical protein
LTQNNTTKPQQSLEVKNDTQVIGKLKLDIDFNRVVHKSEFSTSSGKSNVVDSSKATTGSNFLSPNFMIGEGTSRKPQRPVTPKGYVRTQSGELVHAFAPVHTKRDAIDRLKEQISKELKVRCNESDEDTARSGIISSDSSFEKPSSDRGFTPLDLLRDSISDFASTGDVMIVPSAYPRRKSEYSSNSP